MKKFLTVLAALAMVATPVAAEAHGRDNHNNERPRRSGAGNLIGGIIVGTIIGSAIASSRQPPQDTWDSQYPQDTWDSQYPQAGEYRQRRRVCFREQIVEYYYGRRFIRYEYRCR